MLTKEEIATHRAIQRIGQKVSEITLRDLFAMAVINGMSANPDIINDTFEELAELSYKQADEMLKARGKKNG